MLAAGGHEISKAREPRADRYCVRAAVSNEAIGRVIGRTKGGKSYKAASCGPRRRIEAAGLNDGAGTMSTCRICPLKLINGPPDTALVHSGKIYR